MLAADIRHLRKAFRKDSGQSRAGRLILVNEKASPVYNASLIAKIIRQEAHERYACLDRAHVSTDTTRFESRDSIPGHVQQGGVPSAMDRTRAVRLAIKCMEHMEKYANFTPDQIRADPKSCSVIGIKGASVVFSPMKDVEEKETDWKNRRPLASFWEGLREVVDVLSGRPDVPRPEQDLKGHHAKDSKRGLE